MFITRTQHAKDTNVTSLSFVGAGYDRITGRYFWGVNAGHQSHHRLGDPAVSAKSNGVFEGDIRITDLKNTTWLSVTTRNQRGRRTQYLAPDTAVVVEVKGLFHKTTLAEFFALLPE